MFFNRRDFIKYSSLTMGMTGLMASGLMAKDQKKRKFTDSKALVCISLSGGMDGFNFLLPVSGAKYDEYKSSRQNMAIAQDKITEINPKTNPGFSVGLHSKLGKMADYFNDGKLALLANVGNLVKPITREEYRNKTGKLPAELFSHNSQQKQWQLLTPASELGPGWAGRMSDMMNISDSQLVPTNISLGGFSNWQMGKSSRPFNMSGGDIASYYGMSDSDNTTEMKRREIFKKILAIPNEHLLSNAYGQIQSRAMQITDLLKTSLGELKESSITYPEDNWLGTQLKATAKLIAIQEKLEMPRQIFYVEMGGFDTHDKQVASMDDLFEELGQALEAFWKDLEEYGVADRVLLFSSSEFGRTITSNGDGTDHGWGNHLFVMGNQVKGGEIYGKMPSLIIEGDDDSGDGRIIPTQSAEQYGATIAEWFGFSDTEINELFPNLSSFPDGKIKFI